MGFGNKNTIMHSFMTLYLRLCMDTNQSEKIKVIENGKKMSFY